MKHVVYALVMLAFSQVALSDVTVLEGSEARSKMKTVGEQAVILMQKKKTFYLKTADTTKPKRKPKEVYIKRGDYLFITNDEKKVVHNIYDESDDSWVLTKQDPGEVAAISFEKKGLHVLRCAIHPTMKTTVVVE
ncbi:MAG: hypothetical protein R3183_12210 [Oleiphilaceae bacterium]|nr:hypothetical protein [Oleiphilaceae bacterium]